MTRYLKVLGLAVVAVFAMSAMAASAASASYWFKSDAAAGKKTTLKGEQVGSGDTLTTTAGVVKCTGATYTGSALGSTQTSVTLHPVYTGCTAFGFGAEVTTTGCNYVFDVTATNFSATTTIECEAGKEIIVVAKLAGVTKCTVNIKPISFVTVEIGGVMFEESVPLDVGTVTLTNAVNGVAKDVHADINLEKTVWYKETKGGGAGACTSTSDYVSGGSYAGTATLNGFNEVAEKTNIFLE